MEGEKLLHVSKNSGDSISNSQGKKVKYTVPGTNTALGVSRKTLSKIVNGNSGISPEMAVRLSKIFGSSPESWMGHQVAYDLWQVELHADELNISPLPA